MGQRSDTPEAADWRSSSRCANNSCVEVAALGADSISLRCTERPEHRVTFTRAEWGVFVEAVKAGEFDLDTF